MKQLLKGLGDTMPETIRRMTGASADRFGIRKVMINGRMVCDNGSLDEEALKTSGRAIRG